MSKSLWLDRSLFVSPYYYRLCLTEKDFHKELKRLELPKKDWPDFIKGSRSGATLHTFESDSGYLLAIVNLKDYKNRTDIEVFGLLVHEAQHLSDYCFEELGEAKPSSELKAYAIQSLSQRLMQSYKQQTSKKGKKK